MRSHRSIFALSTILLAAIALSVVGATASDDARTIANVAGQGAVNPGAAPTKPAEQLPLPLVIRIDKAALTKYSDSDVDRPGTIDKIVLGAHCVGDSQTKGTVRAELLPDSQEAAFDMVFRGRTVSTTKGVQEPGVVWSRTFTNFTSKRRVIFEPRKGFVTVGENEIETDTKLVFDGFGSTRNMGRRLITRITARKSYQMAEQARLIADRDNKQEVADTFVKEVDQQVQAANDGLDLVRYVNNFLGDQKTLQLHAKSTQDFIYLGIGPEGEKFAPMAELPTRSDKPAPIEVWAHSSILSTPVAAVVKLVTPDQPIPLPLQGKILAAIALPVTGKATPMDVALRDGWLVLGLPADALPPPVVVAAPQPQDSRQAETNQPVATAQSKSTVAPSNRN